MYSEWTLSFEGLDFCVFIKSTTFKICDVIMAITGH